MSIEPTQALMDAVDALIRALDNDQHYFGDEYLAVKNAQALARNVRATHSAPAGEPVAWLVDHAGLNERDLQFNSLTVADKVSGWTETPLYALDPAAIIRAQAMDDLIAADADLIDYVPVADSDGDDGA